MMEERKKKMWFGTSPHLVVTPTYLESGTLAFIEVSAREKPKGKGENKFLEDVLKVK